jgi:putative flippase GtrA
VISTLAYMLLYLILHPLVGSQASNFLALLVTAIGNTTANRAFTFGVRGRHEAARHQFQGLVIFGIGLAMTSGSLFALHRWDADAPKHLELLVLVVANALATLTRFIGLRWVFRTAGAAEAAAQHAKAANLTAAG